MAKLYKAVFDKQFHTLDEVSNLSNDEILLKIKEEEDAEVSCLYSLDEFNEFNNQGAFTECYILDVFI